MPILEGVSGHKALGGDPSADPELSGGIMYLLWLGITLGYLKRSWKMWLGRKKSRFPSWTCFLKMENGWTQSHPGFYFSKTYL